MAELSNVVDAHADVLAIQRVQLEYARRLDARDLRGYSQLFTEDGVWHGSGARATGPDAIYEMLVEMMDDEVGREYHVITNQRVDLNPENPDTAEASCNFQVITKNEAGEPYLRLFGEYTDRMRRVDGDWRFSYRTTQVLMPFMALEPVQA